MYTSTNPDLTDKIIDYEVGYLTDPTDLVEFFQELIDSGLINHLQGHYVHRAPPRRNRTGDPVMPNIEALERVYDAIYVRQTADSKDSEGRYWDQNTWRDHDECGTAMCFAGWAVELDPGYEFNAHWDDGFLDYVDVFDPDGFLTSIKQAAREILGLSWEQGEELFHGANDIDDIRAIIDSWKD